MSEESKYVSAAEYEENAKQWITDWKIARATLQILWAKSKDWGSGDGADAETLDQIREHLDKIGLCEHLLSDYQPRTIAVAQEMLGMATETMAYAGHDPEHQFANNRGFCLDVVRNVKEALKWLTGSTPLTHKGSVDRGYAEDERGGATLQ